MNPYNVQSKKSKFWGVPLMRCFCWHYFLGTCSSFSQNHFCYLYVDKHALVASLAAYLEFLEQRLAVVSAFPRRATSFITPIMFHSGSLSGSSLHFCAALSCLLASSLLCLYTFVKCHKGLSSGDRRQHIYRLCSLCRNRKTCMVTNQWEALKEVM